MLSLFFFSYLSVLDMAYVPSRLAFTSGALWDDTKCQRSKQGRGNVSGPAHHTHALLLSVAIQAEQGSGRDPQTHREWKRVMEKLCTYSESSMSDTSLECEWVYICVWEVVRAGVVCIVCVRWYSSSMHTLISLKFNRHFFFGVSFSDCRSCNVCCPILTC